jgi:hypothetical protein
MESQMIREFQEKYPGHSFFFGVDTAIHKGKLYYNVRGFLFDDTAEGKGPIEILSSNWHQGRAIGKLLTWAVMDIIKQQEEEEEEA